MAAAGTARGTRSGEPTDGATKSTIVRNATPATSACQNTGLHRCQTPSRVAILKPAQTIVGRSSNTTPTGRVTRDRDADEHEDRGRERPEERLERAFVVEPFVRDAPSDPEHAGGDEDGEGEIAPEPGATQEPAEEDEEHDGKAEQDGEHPADDPRPDAGARKKFLKRCQRSSTRFHSCLTRVSRLAITRAMDDAPGRVDDTPGFPRLRSAGPAPADLAYLWP